MNELHAFQCIYDFIFLITNKKDCVKRHTSRLHNLNNLGSRCPLNFTKTGIKTGQLIKVSPDDKNDKFSNGNLFL